MLIMFATNNRDGASHPFSLSIRVELICYTVLGDGMKKKTFLFFRNMVRWNLSTLFPTHSAESVKSVGRCHANDTSGIKLEKQKQTEKQKQEY